MAQSNIKGPRRRNPLRASDPVVIPAEQPPIPDPLGDDRHIAPSGRLTREEPGHEGLLGSGSVPLPDGGAPEHPIHDHGVLEDLKPEDYEAQIDEAPKTGFEPSEEEGAEVEADTDTDTERPDPAPFDQVMPDSKPER